MRSSLEYAGFAQLCGRSPIMRESMRAHNRIIPRSLVKNSCNETNYLFVSQFRANRCKFVQCPVSVVDQVASPQSEIVEIDRFVTDMIFQTDTVSTITRTSITDKHNRCVPVPWR